MPRTIKVYRHGAEEILISVADANEADRTLLCHFTGGSPGFYTKHIESVRAVAEVHNCLIEIVEKV